MFIFINTENFKLKKGVDAIERDWMAPLKVYTWLEVEICAIFTPGQIQIHFLVHIKIEYQWRSTAKQY